MVIVPKDMRLLHLTPAGIRPSSFCSHVHVNDNCLISGRWPCPCAAVRTPVSPCGTARDKTPRISTAMVLQTRAISRRLGLGYACCHHQSGRPYDGMWSGNVITSWLCLHSAHPTKPGWFKPCDRIARLDPLASRRQNFRADHDLRSIHPSKSIT